MKKIFLILFILLIAVPVYGRGGWDSTTATGTVTTSGTPTIHQWPNWTDATTIKGVSVTASKVVCTDSDGEPVACTNLTDALEVSNTAYDATTWDSVTTIAPSKNAIRDYLESLFPSGSDGNWGVDFKQNTSAIATPAASHMTLAFIGTDLYTKTPAAATTKVIQEQAIIDGSAHVHLTAAQMSNPMCHVSNYGQAAADINIGLPTAASNLSCLFSVSTAQSNHWGVLAAANDGIYILAADGTVSAKGDDAAAAVMTAAQLGQSFACFSIQTGASAWDWLCKAISIGTSTFAAHAAF